MAHHFWHPVRSGICRFVQKPVKSRFLATWLIILFYSLLIPSVWADTLPTIILIHGVGEERPGYYDEWKELLLRGGLVGEIREVYWQDAVGDRWLKRDPEVDNARARRRLFGLVGRFYDSVIGACPDVTRYLTLPHVRKAMRDSFMNEYRASVAHGAPVCVIGHSWGTVIAYESLNQFKPRVPTCVVTLGSPLGRLWEHRNVLGPLCRGIENVRVTSEKVRRFLNEGSARDTLPRAKTEAPLSVFQDSPERPASAQEWDNFYVECDVIGSELLGYRNITYDSAVSVLGDTAGCHDATRHLRDPQVIRSLLAWLANPPAASVRAESAPVERSPRIPRAGVFLKSSTLGVSTVPRGR